jgi:hypothetical protein
MKPTVQIGFRHCKRRHLSSDRSPYTPLLLLLNFLLQIMYLALYIRGIVVVGVQAYDASN